jgi:hypothetical protein
MFKAKWIAGYRWSKYTALLMIVVVFSGITAACQPSQITPDPIMPSPTKAEPTDFPAGFPTPDPEDLAACMADGGRWEVLGFSGPGCNLPTTDGGVPCKDSEECESGCLGDPDLVMITDRYGPPLPDHARMDELNTNNEENVGLCSGWQENYGCQVWVEKGRYVAICVD